MRHTDADGVTRYLLAERSASVQHPLTWAYPGGALRGTRHRRPARRVSSKKSSVRRTPYTVAEIVVDEPTGAGGWFYATVIADVVDRSDLGPPLTRENTGRTCWATPVEMTQLPLHPPSLPLSTTTEEKG